MPCTLKEEIANKNNVDNGKLIEIWPACTGMVNQIRRVQKKVNNGAARNINRFALDGRINSFNNSFRPSAIGCNNPNNPATFGPRLRWILDIDFRSNSVKKAIVNNTDIITIRKFKKYTICRYRNKRER